MNEEEFNIVFREVRTVYKDGSETIEKFCVKDCEEILVSFTDIDGEETVYPQDKHFRMVWNGCDGYIEVDLAKSHGYDYDPIKKKLFKGKDSWDSFWCTLIDEIIEEDMVISTITGKFYKVGLE